MSLLTILAQSLYINSKNIVMPDNKDQTGQQDRIRVDSNDPSEVEYLHKQYPTMSHQQILDAIRIAGPLRADIIAWLDKQK